MDAFSSSRFQPAVGGGAGFQYRHLVFFGAMALGSVLWGQLAKHSSVTSTVVTAAAGSIVALVLTFRVRLGAAEKSGACARGVHRGVVASF